MPFSKGDFLLVEYTVRVKETNTIVDTTDAELAKRENIYESSKIYGPTLIVLGKNWLNAYVEEEISKMNEGEEKEIEVPPEKAFGERDPNKVKIYGLREFQRKGYNVKIGDVIEVGGMRGIVKQVSGGRVVVDFNHPLAGKTLVYKIKIVRKLDDFNERIRALAARHLRIPSNDIEVIYDANEKRLSIKLPAKYVTHENINYAKLSLASDIFELLKEEVLALVYQEEFRKP